MSTPADITREVASQRRHFRLVAPLKIRCLESQQKFSTCDWSIGGFCVKDWRPNLKIDEQFDVEVLVVFDGFDINFETKAQLVRLDKVKNKVAVKFIDLEPRHERLLQHFADSLIRGEMVSIGDTIKRIDVPVSLVSDSPDKMAISNPVIPTDKGRKTALFSGAYLFVGIFFGWYVLATVYDNLFHLRIDSANIVGADSIVSAPQNGVIDTLYVQRGESVEKNQAIAYLRNEDVLESVALAQIEVARAEADLEERRQRLSSQKDKLSSYRKFGELEPSIADTKVLALDEKVRLANKRMARIKNLFDDGLASEDAMDRVSSELAELNGDFDEARAVRVKARAAIDEIAHGRYFTDRKLEGEVGELSSTVITAKIRVQLAGEKLKIMEKRKERLIIKAPFAGQLVSIYSYENENISKGSPLFAVEGSGERGVEAFVPARDMGRVDVDANVRVFLYGESKPLEAMISGIERGPYVNRANSGYSTPLDEDNHPPVRVRLSFLDASTVPKTLRSGLPVAVEFATSNFSIFDDVAEENVASTGVDVGILVKTGI